MNLAIALTAARHGAVVANHVKVTKLHKQAGKLTGASVRVSIYKQNTASRNEHIKGARVASKHR